MTLDISQRLGSLSDNLTPLLVDTLVKWVSPTMDRKKEVMLAVGAKNMIKKTGPTIAQSFVSGYRLVAEARSVWLDMVGIMGRQQVRLGEKERL